VHRDENVGSETGYNTYMGQREGRETETAGSRQLAVHGKVGKGARPPTHKGLA
jgi:hypothetical protein